MATAGARPGAQPRRWPRWIGAGIALLIGGAIWLSLGLPLPGIRPPSLLELVTAAGPLGPAASVSLMIAHTVVPFPAEVLVAANAMAFGPAWGAAVSWIGAMLGAYLGFGLSRLCGRRFVERWVEAERLQRLDAMVERHGKAGLLALRLLPVVSFNLVNYAAGLTKIDLWTFTWTTALGILPWTLAFSFGGDQLLQAVQGEWEAIGWVLLVLVAALATAVVAWRWGRETREPKAPGSVGPERR